VSGLFAHTNAKYALELVRPRRHDNLQAELLFTGPLDVSRKPLNEQLVEGAELKEREAQAVHEQRLRRKREPKEAFLINQLITSATPGRLDQLLPRFKTQAFPEGMAARIPVALAPQQQRLFGLRVFVPPQARTGEVITLDLVKRNTSTGKVLGGIAVSVNII
jgi:hypothetical protein